MELLNHTHPALFIWIGGISLFLGLLNAILTSLTRSSGKDKRKLSS
jgi:hypothetical protein